MKFRRIRERYILTSIKLNDLSKSRKTSALLVVYIDQPIYYNEQTLCFSSEMILYTRVSKQNLPHKLHTKLSNHVEIFYQSLESLLNDVLRDNSFSR